MKFKVGEINIICTDIERSMTFYRDLLGFEVLSEEDGAWHLLCGGVAFLLLPVAMNASDKKPYCVEPGVSFDLMVQDIQIAFNYFKDNDVEFEMELKEDCSYFFIRDPDGLVIEIVG